CSRIWMRYLLPSLPLKTRSFCGPCAAATAAKSDRQAAAARHARGKKWFGRLITDSPSAINSSARYTSANGDFKRKSKRALIGNHNDAVVIRVRDSAFPVGDVRRTGQHVGALLGRRRLRRDLEIDVMLRRGTVHGQVHNHLLSLACAHVV